MYPEAHPGCVLFDVPTWAGYGTPERHPKTAPQNGTPKRHPFWGAVLGCRLGRLRRALRAAI